VKGKDDEERLCHNDKMNETKTKLSENNTKRRTIGGSMARQSRRMDNDRPSLQQNNSKHKSRVRDKDMWERQLKRKEGEERRKS
jgi:hypothetical protein